MSDLISVILNPASGSAEGDSEDKIREAFAASGARIEFSKTTPDLPATELASRAAKSGAHQVVACGGDGTVMGAINGLGIQDGTRAPLFAVVPLGTANLFATAIGIPVDIDEAVSAAIDGDERAIDLGRYQGRLFALGVGAGLMEKIISKTDSDEKDKLGRLAYAKAVVSELGHEQHTFTFSLDQAEEQSERGVAVVIANAGQVGARASFAPNAKPDDGLLDLCIIKSFLAADAIRMTWSFVTGGLDSDPGISYYQARNIRIASDTPLDVQVDGESVDSKLPLEAQALPAALRLRVPVLRPE